MKKSQAEVKRVVGLSYKGDGGELPKVVLKGSGEQVDKVMLKRQSLFNPPSLVEDKKLLQALYSLPVEAEIDNKTFELVAMLLVHIYSVEEKIAIQEQYLEK